MRPRSADLRSPKEQHRCACSSGDPSRPFRSRHERPRRPRRSSRRTRSWGEHGSGVGRGRRRSGSTTDGRLPAMPSAEPGGIGPSRHDVERWLDELGLEASRPGRSRRRHVVGPPARRPPAVRPAHHPDPRSVARRSSAGSTSPRRSATRSASRIRKLLRWNDEFPFVKFSLAEDERPVLATRAPARGAGPGRARPGDRAVAARSPTSCSRSRPAGSGSAGGSRTPVGPVEPRRPLHRALRGPARRADRRRSPSRIPSRSADARIRAGARRRMTFAFSAAGGASMRPGARRSPSPPRCSWSPRGRAPARGRARRRARVAAASTG